MSINYGEITTSNLERIHSRVDVLASCSTHTFMKQTLEWVY